MQHTRATLLQSPGFACCIRQLTNN